ncbi:MAG TPA: aspartyl protease family protein [Caulobacteraceae bacterium]
MRGLALAAALATLASSQVARADCKLGIIATLPVTMDFGSPVIEAKINGVAVRFITDSGAFFSVISPGVANELHLRLQPGPFGMYMKGIGGSTSDIEVADIKSFSLGNVSNFHAEFAVAGSEAGPGLAGLIGRNILTLADVEYDLADGVIRLVEPKGCGRLTLAYWIKPDQSYGEVDMEPEDDGPRSQVFRPPIRATASVNGKRIVVEFDSGARGSMLSLAAARRLGLDPNAQGVVPAGQIAGVGRHRVRSWIAPVDDFGIGGENVQHTRLRIGDFELDDADMLIGDDFLLSHRVYIANSQHKIYFTYNGGPVFMLEVSPAEPAAVAAGPEPTDAAGFARRAAARAARRNLAGAKSDYSKAMTLDAKVADYPLGRGTVEREAGDNRSAMADLDRALALDPNSLRGRLERASLRLEADDDTGALVDLDAADKMLPGGAHERLILADLYLSVGAPDRAAPAFDAWVKAHPEDNNMASALAGRCFANALVGDRLEQAKADCEKSRRLVHGEVLAFEGRGYARLRLGDLDGAIGDFTALLNVRKTAPWALWGRGLAEEKKGQVTQAKADFTAARAARPGIEKEAERFGLGAPKT